MSKHQLVHPSTDTQLHHGDYENWNKHNYRGGGWGWANPFSVWDPTLEIMRILAIVRASSSAPPKTSFVCSFVFHALHKAPEAFGWIRSTGSWNWNLLYDFFPSTFPKYMLCKISLRKRVPWSYKLLYTLDPSWNFTMYLGILKTYLSSLIPVLRCRWP